MILIRYRHGFRASEACGPAMAPDRAKGRSSARPQAQVRHPQHTYSSSPTTKPRPSPTRTMPRVHCMTTPLLMSRKTGGHWSGQKISPSIYLNLFRSFNYLEFPKIWLGMFWSNDFMLRDQAFAFVFGVYRHHFLLITMFTKVTIRCFRVPVPCFKRYDITGDTNLRKKLSHAFV